MKSIIHVSKNTLTVILSLFITTCFAQLENGPKLSANTAQYLWKQKNLYKHTNQILNECVYRQDANGTTYLATLIKVSPSIDVSDLKDLKIKVGSKSGDIWTAYVPLEHVEAFTQVAGIEYIEIDRPTGIFMDKAREKTFVDSVHNGINLPQAYKGEGVVVGIIDAGFDYTHPAVFDTSYTHFRLKKVWEQKGTGTPPSGFAFGAEYSDSASIFDQETDMAAFSHGAHVAGIAGGSGYRGTGGSHQLFKGMAYNSDLVFVGILPAQSVWQQSGLTDLMDGINYVYDYAASVNKPAIANISWGGPLGPRDGTSLFSQGCDNATGVGKILTLSAGNNGGSKVHLQKNFTSTDTIVHTIVDFSSSLPSKTNWVDVWGGPSDNYCVKFKLRNTQGQIDSSAQYCIDDSTHQIILIGNQGDTCFITLTSEAVALNGKTHMYLDIYNKASEDLEMIVTSQNTSIDMWNGYIYGARGYYPGFTKKTYSFCTNGDDVMSSSDMAATNSAIAVGAYVSRNFFNNSSGSSLSFGQSINRIASFSSLGPTADGRTKPNITGPGSAIASSINSADVAFNSGGSSYSLVGLKFTSPLNGKTYSYAYLQGTSMSSPAVAGIVALMLQANPNLTPTQVQTILYNTAIQDFYTGTLPSTGDNTWGWGKVNAYQAVAAALTLTGIHHEASPTSLEGLLYPNPSKGNYAIELNAEKDEIMNLSLIDVQGRILESIEWPVAKGSNTYQAYWEHLAAGVYFVKLKGQTGELNIKIIKE
ncbi:MAG: S8 family serine peptidase [Aureispira sp.]|nr:S8 family serine peptidase [Aureispira sp.]